MKRIALITGATSGIGRATALLLAQNNFDIIITGRRSDRLIETENKLKEQSDAKVLSLNFDIRDEKQVSTAMANLPDEWKNIYLLVNNAGLASGLEPLNQGDLNDWEQMIDTNIKGLLYITRIVSQWMIENKLGHIINISSLAGKEVYANGNVYCATKHAVEALTKGMRLDFLKHNIKVGSVSPGMVDTEFSLVRFHGDQPKAEAVYAGLTPLFADDIADAILYMVTRPKHVNIDDLFITPTAQGFSRDTFRQK